MPRLLRRGEIAVVIFLCCSALVAGALLAVNLNSEPEALGASSTGTTGPATGNTPPPASTVSLKQQKLAQEVEQLKLQNDDLRRHQSTLERYVSDYGGVTAGLVALLGVLVTIWKQIGDQSHQRQADRGQRDKDRAQREADSARDQDARLQSAVMNLGSASEAVRVGAAATLISFVRPEYQRLLHEVRLITLANLKIQHDQSVRRLLVRAFGAAARTGTPLAGVELDLAGAHLERAELSGITLAGGDLGFAQLTSADLRGCDLSRVHGREAVLTRARICGPGTSLEAARMEKAIAANTNFQEARLVSAHFEGADLTRAKFQRAQLQAAHFENATLYGAKFQQADLNDCYFTNARLDDDVRRTIVRAKNWQHAHFSADERAALDRLEGAHATEDNS